MIMLPDIRIVDLTLYLEKQKIIVIGDTHIGYEEALNKQGILIPRMHLKEIISSLDKVFKQVRPDTIVLLGDVKHEFGTISRQEWQDTLALIDYLTGKAKLIIIKGNHDTILKPIADKKKVEIHNYYSAGEFFFCHGDKLVDEKMPDFKKAKTIIIGHEHPAISVRDGLRIEKYKCFLLGDYKKKNLIVVPSFNFVSEGTDVLREKLLSPFIKNIERFKAFIAAEKIYDFGKIKFLAAGNKEQTNEFIGCVQNL